jgi:hypothetical protein
MLVRPPQILNMNRRPMVTLQLLSCSKKQTRSRRKVIYTTEIHELRNVTNAHETENSFIENNLSNCFRCTIMLSDALLSNTWRTALNVYCRNIRDNVNRFRLHPTYTRKIKTY